MNTTVIVAVFSWSTGIMYLFTQRLVVLRARTQTLIVCQRLNQPDVLYGLKSPVEKSGHQ